MALRCLIVDDSPDFLRWAGALLEQEGLQIVGIASTGADALVGVAELCPDVTLVDVDLGGTSGFELARRLAGDPHLDPGHVILISVQAEDDLADMIEASPAIAGVPQLHGSESPRIHALSCGNMAAPGDTSCH
jgi:CheY-like chemotaxis protein